LVSSPTSAAPYAMSMRTMARKHHHLFYQRLKPNLLLKVGRDHELAGMKPERFLRQPGSTPTAPSDRGKLSHTDTPSLASVSSHGYRLLIIEANNSLTTRDGAVEIPKATAGYSSQCSRLSPVAYARLKSTFSAMTEFHAHHDTASVSRRRIAGRQAVVAPTVVPPESARCHLRSI
jgi:hypothetical protein